MVAPTANRIFPLKLADAGRARLGLQGGRDQQAQEEKPTPVPRHVEQASALTVQPQGFLDRAEEPVPSRPDAIDPRPMEIAVAPATSAAVGGQQVHVPPTGTRVSGAMGVPADDGSSIPEPSREAPGAAIGESVLARRPGDPDPYAMAGDFEADEANMNTEHRIHR